MSISNAAGKEMAGGIASSSDWRKWCRLCAKEDKQNRNIYLKEEFVHREEHATAERLISVINNYFSVDIQMLDKLPQQLCIECLSFLKTLISFQIRVVKVQQMYVELQNSQNISESNNQARALRLKCQLMDATGCEGSSIMDIKQEEEEVASADEGVCDFQSEEVADCEDDPFGTSAEDSIDDADTEVCSGAEISGPKLEVKILKGKFQKKTQKKNYKQNTEKHIDYGTTATRPTVEYKYSCAECPKRFQRTSSYRLHLNKKHGISEKPTYPCNKCQRTFKNGFNLKRHLQTHRPKAEKKIYPCPQCDRKFQTKDYVATHIKFVHEDIRPLICEECGEGVRTQGALREHMLTHTDYAPFECDVCKKCFKNQSRLKNHKEIHSAEKHICSECGLQLNSRVTLNRHMLVHSDVMQHKCDYCGRAFKRAKTLKSHLILHSGLKPYSCKFCDRTFTNGSNCRTHMKRTHPNELAEMEASGERNPTKNIPKLAVLKAVIKKADNLVPVVSKQSGNFSSGKKLMIQMVDAACTKKV